MRLVLGGEYSGKQIMEAFKRAATASFIFLVASIWKWATEEFPAKAEQWRSYEMKDGELQLTWSRVMGVEVYPSRLVERKRWLFFGKKEDVWRRDSDFFLVLSPLREKGTFTEVEIKFEKVYDYGDFKEYYSTESPPDGIRKFSPEGKKDFNTFISAFLEELKKKN